MVVIDFITRAFPLEASVRNVARNKLGYYPLPQPEGVGLRKLLAFEAGASAVDPCIGTGAALHQLTKGAEVEKHGVELDAGRAAAAAASGITTVHGNLFETIGKAESFSFLYLNPPYDISAWGALTISGTRRGPTRRSSCMWTATSATRSRPTSSASSEAMRRWAPSVPLSSRSTPSL
ncbi:MAG TPA: DUF6094 domain-containing protein [Edaphobacter sp.]|nr:DUF6094 domain-containing protein [Edaphobacter sp.]